MSQSPELFRRELLLSPESRRSFKLLIQPWQETAFQALDSAWLQLAGFPVTANYQRAYIERPRGHAKTSDMAVQIAWTLLFSKRRVSGLAAAADRDQAALIWDAVGRIKEANPLLCPELVFQKHLIVNRNTGSRLEIISSDVNSSWGALPDFVICDELCHWEKPDMWYSLLSSAAKRPHCVLAVMTNAGVGRGWQWDVREAARNRSDWFFSSLSGSQAPWISSRFLSEQQELLPRPVYERLWQNIWQHSDGEFLTLNEVEACRDSQLTKHSHGQPHLKYIAAVDYAEKHDYTVGVVIHFEGSRIVVDSMDVAVPHPDQPVKVEWVEQWMKRAAANFSGVTFILDEYQLLGTIQKLESQYDIHRFEFSAGRGNHALALNLRKLIIHREVAWYPECGQIEDSPMRDDLETELASLLLKQSPSGRCRITHHRDRHHHDDRSFALGAACLFAVRDLPDVQWMQVTAPTREGEFNW